MLGRAVLLLSIFGVWICVRMDYLYREIKLRKKATGEGFW